LPVISANDILFVNIFESFLLCINGVIFRISLIEYNYSAYFHSLLLHHLLVLTETHWAVSNNGHKKDLIFIIKKYLASVSCIKLKRCFVWSMQ
jgi:hypothetical protein